MCLYSALIDFLLVNEKSNVARGFAPTRYPIYIILLNTASESNNIKKVNGFNASLKKVIK
jgi:hypothetical protein